MKEGIGTQMVNKSYKLRIREIRENNKSKGSVEFKKNDEYYTPLSVINKVTGGQIDYDPATNDHKAKEFGVLNYDTIETNGLTTDWAPHNRIWVNPPFTMKKEFMQKAVDTVRANPKATVWFLVPIETLTTKWFNAMVPKYDLIIPNGRVKFENPSSPRAKSPAFGSIIIVLGNGANMRIKPLEI